MNAFRWCMERCWQEAYRMCVWPLQYWLFVWPNEKIGKTERTVWSNGKMIRKQSINPMTKQTLFVLYPLIPTGSELTINDDGSVEIFLSRGFFWEGKHFSSGKTLVVNNDGKVERFCKKEKKKK